MNTSQSSVFDKSLDTLVEFGKWIAAVGLVLAIACIAIVVSRVKDHRTPEYALEQIKSVKSEADIKDHEDYLTARGRKTFAIALSAANDEGVHPSFGVPTEDGDTVVVPFTDPKAEGRFEFKKDGVWQLDNIILTKMKGRTYYADLSSVAEPLYALGKAMGDKSKGQILADTRYLTDKGQQVRLWLLEQNGEHSKSDDDVIFDEPVVDNDDAYLSMHALDGQTELRFVIVKHYDGWKFDDVVAVKVQGKTINLAISDKLNNPFGTWLRSLLW